MPPEDQWESYFDAPRILAALADIMTGDVVEFGCGYGTFTLPAARRTRGTVYAMDIEPEMVRATAARVALANIANVVVERRDFVERGCGRPEGSVSLALLFNILHIEDPVSLLREVYRALGIGGIAGVIHWNHDSGTPRGPTLDIRPTPAEVKNWAALAGLHWVASPALPGSPWHWGMVLERRAEAPRGV